MLISDYYASLVVPSNLPNARISMQWVKLYSILMQCPYSLLLRSLCLTKCVLAPIFVVLITWSFQVEVTTVFGSAAPSLKVNLVQVLGSDSKVITSENKVYSWINGFLWQLPCHCFCVLQLQFPNVILLFVSGTSIWPWQQCPLLGHCSTENRCWEILNSFWGSCTLHLIYMLVVGIVYNGGYLLYYRFHFRNQSMRLFMLLEGETLKV
jgi:hypothetical protein